MVCLSKYTDVAGSLQSSATSQLHDLGDRKVESARCNAILFDHVDKRYTFLSMEPKRIVFAALESALDLFHALQSTATWKPNDVGAHRRKLPGSISESFRSNRVYVRIQYDLRQKIRARTAAYDAGSPHGVPTAMKLRE